jgi:hypothetical protein
MNYDEIYTFEWEYETSQECGNCNLTIPDEKKHKTDGVCIPEAYYKGSIQESLNDFVDRDSMRKVRYQICKEITKTIRRNSRPPNVRLGISRFLEKHLISFC